MFDGKTVVGTTLRVEGTVDSLQEPARTSARAEARGSPQPRLPETIVSEVAPFPAIRYDTQRFGGDLSSVLAPPYDVLDEADKKALLARSDRNITAIDLPHLPPKSAGPAEVYDRAAAALQDWLRDGTLTRDPVPALYLYHQRFEHDGRPFTRRMFIARLRLQPFSEGSILPHERTFGGPKEDRLALMKATQCQLSPIFGLYSDPTNKVAALLAATASRPVDAVGTVDDVESKLWVVSDPNVIQSVVAAMADRKVYIADGHHRYGTALMYRDRLREQHGGALPDGHPANYVMFVLAGMDDPGCLILPYYRVLEHIDADALAAAWSAGTDKASAGGADVVLWDGRSGKETPLKFIARAKLATLEPGESPAWRQLDYAYLHRYLIDELLPRKLGTAPVIHYVKSLDEAKQAARESAGVALLVNATPMVHLRAVAESGGLMPQKSTYFFPKLATGLTIHSLT